MNDGDDETSGLEGKLCRLGERTRSLTGHVNKTYKKENIMKQRNLKNVI